MERGAGSSLKHWHWQYTAAIILILLNVDFILVPILRKMEFSGLPLFAIASIFGTVELICWFQFWSWFRKLIIQSGQIQEGINLGKEIKKELQKSGYLDHAIDYFVKTFSWATRKENGIFKLIKAGGYLSMFVAGILPEPGSRTTAVVFCATLGWKKGLLSLILGNILHMAYIVGGWEFIFRLLGS